MFFPCSPYRPTSGGCYKHPVRSWISKIWSTFSANRCQLLQLLCTLFLLPYSLPTQNPSTEIKLCRQTPQGLPEDILFLWENELLTFLPPKSMRCSSRCRVCGPELGPAGAVLHQAGSRAAAGAIGGSSFQPHPGHASQGEGVELPSTAALTSPAPWMKSRLLAVNARPSS